MNKPLEIDIIRMDEKSNIASSDAPALKHTHAVSNSNPNGCPQPHNRGLLIHDGGSAVLLCGASFPPVDIAVTSGNVGICPASVSDSSVSTVVLSILVTR